jgi:colicin import membrane protein
MTYERSSNSYVSSLLLHGAVVAVILFFTYVLDQDSPPPPKIFELVAGAGDNYAATEAPALGVPGGIKMNIPAAPAPAEPAPAESAQATLQAEPEPVAARITPAKASPAKNAPAKAAKKIPDFARSLERTAARVAKRIETKYKKQQEAEERRQMTLDEYMKEHPSASRAAGEGIREGVIGGSANNKTGGAGGKALTREEGSELDAYWAMLISQLTANLDKPTDVSDALTAEVEFYVSADGSISEVQISRSSGNDEFDQAVLEAVRRTHSIGPRPDGQGDRVKVPFKMHEDDASP